MLSQQILSLLCLPFHHIGRSAEKDAIKTVMPGLQDEPCAGMHFSTFSPQQSL
jgi:hypothetical protein